MPRFASVVRALRLVWSIVIFKGNKYLDSLHTHLCSSAFSSYKCECQPPHLSTMQRMRQSRMICIYTYLYFLQFNFLFGKATPAPAPTPLVFNDKDGLDAINISSPIIVVPVLVPSDSRSRSQDTPSMPTPIPTIKLVDSREDICIDMFSGHGCAGGVTLIRSQA